MERPRARGGYDRASHQGSFLIRTDEIGQFFPVPLCDTIEMAKRTDTSPPELTTPLPTDAAGLEDALTALLAERVSLQDALAAHPERERRLLARKAAEAEIAGNDIQRRRIVFQLDEIDRREQEIRTALQVAERDQQQAVWHGFVAEFDRASERFADAGAMLREAREDLLDLHRRAAAAGYNEHQHPSARIPAPALIDFDGIDQFRGHLPHLRRVDARAPERVKAFLVRFAVYTIVGDPTGLRAYQKGAVAGFDAAAAWRLVDQNKAAWADNDIPPRPTGSRARQRPVEERV